MYGFTNNQNIRFFVINKYERAAEASGVVLIDELDMHLYPKWQWNIIHALQKTFSNVQFIAAMHFPILIASCKNGHLVSVDKDIIRISRDLNQILNLNCEQARSRLVLNRKKSMKSVRKG